MSQEELNPLLALLQQHTSEKTILDTHFQSHQLSTRDMSKTQENNIDNGSFFAHNTVNQLHDPLEEKNKGNYEEGTLQDEDCISDPLIVFDKHAEEEGNDLQISLGVRQPSFISLHGTLIAKGGESYDEMKLNVENVAIEEIPEAPTVLNIDSNADPQMKIIHQLCLQNQTKWNEIGYQPPDLLPMTRSHSLHKIQQPQIKSNSPNSASLNCLPTIGANHTIVDSKLGSILTNIPSETQFSQSSLKKPKLEKEGMQLGESSVSVEMMKEIIYQKPATLTEFSIENYEETAEENELMGHLPEIIDVPKDSAVYRILLTQEIPEGIDLTEVRPILRQYHRLCAEHLWIDETAYLNEILEIIGQPESEGKKIGFTRPNGEEDIQKLKTESKSKIQSFEQRIADLLKEMEEAIRQLDVQYSTREKQLDEQFHDQQFRTKFMRPSRELLNLKDKLSKAILTGDVEEADNLNQQIQSRQEQENKHNKAKLKESYFNEDEKLKEDFKQKRTSIVNKYQYQIQKIRQQQQNSAEIYKNRIKKIKHQMDNNEYYTSGSRATSRASATDRLSVCSSKSRLTNASEMSVAQFNTLKLKPPHKLDRTDDILLLQEMSERILNGQKIEEIDLETCYQSVMERKKKKNA